MKKYTVEMTESEYKKLKKMLTENKKQKKKKNLTESLKPMTLYKITSFEAAKRYAKGIKWSLSSDERMFDHYTNEYNYFILYLNNHPEFAILTYKDNDHSPAEIRDARMKKWDWEGDNGLQQYLKSNGYPWNGIFGNVKEV